MAGLLLRTSLICLPVFSLHCLSCSHRTYHYTSFKFPESFCRGLCRCANVCFNPTKESTASCRQRPVNAIQESVYRSLAYRISTAAAPQVENFIKTKKKKKKKNKSRIMLAKISSTRLREKIPIEEIYTYHLLVSDLFKRTLDFKVKQPYL